MKERALLTAIAVTVLALASASEARHSTVVLPGLDGPVHIVRDREGVPHIYASSNHDAMFAVGWVQAGDRFFQMDFRRRQASGRLAELVGPSALASDVQLRTLGLRRAAERSLPALTPQTRADLEAYAGGVNAWLAQNPLPAEYQALELTKASVPSWTALDSTVVGKLQTANSAELFNTIPIEIGNTQRLMAYSAALGPTAGAALFFEDVNRLEPFAHVPSILPGESLAATAGRVHAHPLHAPSAANLEPILERLQRAGLTPEASGRGSNAFAVGGVYSATGNAMVANDPHIQLGSPAVFHEIGITVTPGEGGEALDVYGVGLPGLPYVVHGMNDHIAWGSTDDKTDVTDVYQEQLVTQGGVPAAIVHQGQQEPLDVNPETYRANAPADGTTDDLTVVPPGPAIPPATFVVPRRNHGPLISVSPALSVQFTGFAATRELDFLRLLARARTVEEAREAVRYFDVGAQNWMMADDTGSIAYFTSGEVPLREDLQAGSVNGLPPWFIRNGTGGNEWIADAAPAEDQANPYELLPFAELDQLQDPARGWIANANQDPHGTTFDNDPLNELRPGGGIRYTASTYELGMRNARVSARMEEALSGGVTFEELQSIQADVKLYDAEIFAPYLEAALQAARTPGAPAPLAALGGDPGVVEAVGRIASWDHSTPTGIVEGWDAGAPAGTPPSQAEIDASVATTIYSLWRGRLIVNTIDATLQSAGLGGFLPFNDRAMVALRHLLEVSDQTGGVGASGLDFFAAPGLPTPAARRDYILLKSMRDALALAASPAFAPAFGASTDQSDYRWGKLHRVVFVHPIGGPFSVPPGAGFAGLAPLLPGIPTDGGFTTVDASPHGPRAAALNAFMFGLGPARRFVAEPRRSHPRAVQVIPGGESGTPVQPFFGNQLELWLANDYHDVTLQRGEVERDAVSVERLMPEETTGSND